MRKNFEFILALLLVLAIVGNRLLPMPANVSILTAVSLFAGFLFRRGPLAFAVPLLGLFLSDLVLGFHSYMLWVYGGFALAVLIGSYLNRARSLGVATAAFASSVAFYLLTNFGVWLQGSLYAHNWTGLVECYTMALPFFRNSLLSDLSVSLILFSVYSLLSPRLLSSPVKNKL